MILPFASRLARARAEQVLVDARKLRLGASIGSGGLAGASAYNVELVKVEALLNLARELEDAERAQDTTGTAPVKENGGVTEP